MHINSIPNDPAAAEALASSANVRENTTKPFLIRVATLEDLRHLPPPRLAPAGVRVDIRLAGIEGAERELFERRLTRELAACGCREGGIGVLLYIATATLLAVLGVLAPKSMLAWLTMIGGLLAAGLLGKIIGLTIAQMRLNRIAVELALAAGKGRAD